MRRDQGVFAEHFGEGRILGLVGTRKAIAHLYQFLLLLLLSPYDLKCSNLQNCIRNKYRIHGSVAGQNKEQALKTNEKNVHVVGLLEYLSK